MGKKFKYTALIFFVGFWMYSITEPLYTPTALPVGTNHYDFPAVIAHKALTSDEFPGNSLSAITESLSSTVDVDNVGFKHNYFPNKNLNPLVKLAGTMLT